MTPIELTALIGGFCAGLGVGITLTLVIRYGKEPDHEPEPPGPNAAYKIPPPTQAVRRNPAIHTLPDVRPRVVHDIPGLARDIDRILPNTRVLHVVDWDGDEQPQRGA